MCQDLHLLLTPRTQSPQSPQAKDPLRFPKLSVWSYTVVNAANACWCLFAQGCFTNPPSDVFVYATSCKHLSVTNCCLFPGHSQLYRRTSKDRSWSRGGSWRGEGKVLRIGSLRSQSHAANECLERRTPQRCGKMCDKMWQRYSVSIQSAWTLHGWMEGYPRKKNLSLSQKLL